MEQDKAPPGRFGCAVVSSLRLAAVDVGTNSIRCIVAETVGESGYRILDDEKATVRLGEGVRETGRIGAPAWHRALDALNRMRKIYEGFGVELVEAVATNAVRRAENGTEFLEAMEREAGVSIRVIGGEEEAELAGLSAHHNFITAEERHAIIDIGGGSTEVAVAKGNLLDAVVSMEFGAMQLWESCVANDPPTPKEIKKIRKAVRKEFKRVRSPEMEQVPWVIGSGGTVTAIGSLVSQHRKESYGTGHGNEVFRSEVVHLRAMLTRLDRQERIALKGISPERAEIILPGVIAVDEIMELLGANVLKVNERGIREGIVLRALSKAGRSSSGWSDWRDSANKLAEVCHADMRHAQQTKKLSLVVFDAVRDQYELTGRQRDLLEAAAIVHDIGYFIAFGKHHKRSYHLIRHSDLAGFTPREREIVANVARYHRGAKPKKSHENLQSLNAADRELVRKLGGILRLADGLDRRRGAQVEELEADLEDGKINLRVAGYTDLSVEIHGAGARADLFADAFGLEVLVERL